MAEIFASAAQTLAFTMAPKLHEIQVSLLSLSIYSTITKAHAARRLRIDKLILLHDAELHR
jgi:hypothetical protein